MNQSKKYKLPKYMWRPGKSKFLALRLRQEGIIALTWIGYGRHESGLSQLHNKITSTEAGFVTKIA